MQRSQFRGADLPNQDIEQLIVRAKIARADFIRDNARHVFRRISWSNLACGLAVLLILGASSTPRQVVDNTAVIERLATTLDQIERVKPGTVSEVAQLLRRPDYDCRQIACEAGLEKRNLAARARLETILAKHSVVAMVAAKR